MHQIKFVLYLAVTAIVWNLCTSSHIILDTNVSLPNYFTGGNFTEEVWLRLYESSELRRNLIQNEVLFNLLRTENSFELTINTNFEVGLNVWKDDMTQSYSSESPIPILTKQWIHLCLAYSKESGVAVYASSELFIAQQLTLQIAHGSHFLVFSENSISMIAYNYRYWSHYLSQEEIFSIYNLNPEDLMKSDLYISNWQKILSWYELSGGINTTCIQDWGVYANHICSNEYALLELDESSNEPYAMSEIWENLSLNLNSLSVKIHLSDSLNLNKEWMIEFWVSFSSITESSPIISQNSCSNGLHINQEGNKLIWFPDYPLTNKVISEKDASYGWIFVAFMNDYENSQRTIFNMTVDSTEGIISKIVTSSERGANICKNSPIYINYAKTLTSKIQEFRVWGRIRNQYEIQQLAYRQLYSREHPDLVSYFPFNEKSGHFEDHTENKANATIMFEDLSFKLSDIVMAGTNVCPRGWMYYDNECIRLKYFQQADPTTMKLLQQSISSPNFEYSSETIGFWIYFNSIVTKNLTSRANDFNLTLNDGKYFLYLYYLDGETILNTDSFGLAETNKWIYIIFCKTIAPLINSASFNGTVLTQISPSHNLLSYSGNILYFVGIGTGVTGTTDIYFKDFSIMSRYTSPVELQSLYYKRQFSTQDYDLIRYYKMENIQSQTYIIDSSFFNLQEVSEGYTQYGSNSIHVCPYYKRAPNENLCLEPGVLLLNTKNEDQYFYISAPSLNINSSFTFQTIFKIMDSRTSNIFLLKMPQITIGIDENSEIFVSFMSSITNTEYSFSFDESKISASIFYSLSLVLLPKSGILYLDDKMIQTIETDEYIVFNLETIDENGNINEQIILSSGGGRLWLREYRIWNRILSQPEIDYYLFSQIEGREFPQSLRLYYKMDEAGENTLFDHSYRWDSDTLFAPTITTIFSQNLGVTWDTHTNLLVCESHHRRVNNQCFLRRRILRFIDGESNVAQNSNIEIGNEYTFEFWVYLEDQETSVIYILQKEEHINIFVVGGNIIKFEGKNGNLNRKGHSFLSQSIEKNKWNFVAISNSRLLDRSILIINEEYVSDLAFEITNSSLISSRICIGGTCDSSYNMAGFFRELKLWRKYKSPGFILQGCNKTLRGDESYLYGYWKLDDSVGNYARDLTINELHFDLGDSPAWIYRKNESDIRLCTFEEGFDRSSISSDSTLNLFEGCILPKSGLKLGEESASLLLTLDENGEQKVEDFTFEILIYFDESFSSTLSIVWNNRFQMQFFRDNLLTPAIQFNIMGEASISYPEFSLVGMKWIGISLIVSSTDENVKFLAYDFSENSVLVYRSYKGTLIFEEALSSYVTITNNAENSGADTTGTGTGNGKETEVDSLIYLKEIRLWSKAINYTAESIPFRKQLEPYNHPQLVSYWNLIEYGGSLIRDSSVFSTTESKSNSFKWEYTNLPLINACPSNSYYSNGMCIEEVSELLISFNNVAITCKVDYCKCQNVSGELCQYNVDGNILLSNYDITITIQNATNNVYHWQIYPYVAFTHKSNHQIFISKNSIQEGQIYSISFATQEAISATGLFSRIHNFFIPYSPIGTTTQTQEESPTFTITPTAGNAFDTEFIINTQPTSGISYSDPESTILEYKYSYQRKGESQRLIIKPYSSTTSVSFQFPQGLSEEEYTIYVYVTVRNSYGAFLEESTQITVEPTTTSATSDDIIAALKTAAEEGTSSVVQTVELTTYEVIPEDTIYSILESCTLGFCQNGGNCSEETGKCICPDGYSFSKDCSINDLEYENTNQIKQILLIELQELVESQTSIEEILSDEDSTDSFLNSLGKIVQNQFIQTTELNSGALDVLLQIAQSQNQLTASAQSAGFSEISLEDSYKSLNYIVEGISQYNDTELKQTSPEDLSKVSQVLRELTIHTLKDAEEGETQDHEYPSFKSTSTKISAQDLTDLEITTSTDDQSVTLKLPQSYLVASDSEEAFAVQVTIWKENPFESLHPYDYNHFVQPISADLMNLVELTKVKVDNLDDPVKVEYKIEENLIEYLNNGIEVLFIEEDGTLSEEGISWNEDEFIRIESEVDGYITFYTNHLTDFAIYFQNYTFVDTEGKIMNSAFLMGIILTFMMIMLMIGLFVCKDKSKLKIQSLNQTETVTEIKSNLTHTDFIPQSENQIAPPAQKAKPIIETEAPLKFEDLNKDPERPRSPFQPQGDPPPKCRWWKSQTVLPNALPQKLKRKLKNPLREIIKPPKLESPQKSLGDFSSNFEISATPEESRIDNSSIMLDQVNEVKFQTNKMLQKPSCNNDKIMEDLPISLIFKSSHMLLSWSSKYKSLVKQSVRLFLVYLKYILLCLFVGIGFSNNYLSTLVSPTRHFLIGLICLTICGSSICILQWSFKFSVILHSGRNLQTAFGFILGMGISIGCLVWTGLTGKRVGTTICNEWTLTCIFGIIFDGIVLQPLKFLLIVLIIKMKESVKSSKSMFRIIFLHLAYFK